MVEKSSGEGITRELGFHNKKDSAIEKNRTEVLDQITGNAVVNTNR